MFKSKLKLLTMRSNGMGYERRKEVLHTASRGWVNYFKYADAKTALQGLDEWLRRRIRMCIWKSWKLPRTRVRNLIKCGIPQWRAYQWGNSSKGYWAVAGSFMKVAANNRMLKLAGYPSLMEYYDRYHRI